MNPGILTKNAWDGTCKAARAAASDAGCVATYLDNLMQHNKAFRQYAANTLAEALREDLTKELITQREAYRRYGRKHVTRWVAEKKIIPQRISHENRVYYKQNILIKLSNEIRDL